MEGDLLQAVLRDEPTDRPFPKGSFTEPLVGDANGRLWVIQPGTVTPSAGGAKTQNVSITDVVSTILVADDNRTINQFQNQGSFIIYLDFGNTVVAGAGVFLRPGEFYNPGFNWPGAVTAVCDAGNVAQLGIVAD